MKKTAISLIHNKNEERNCRIRPNIERLSKRLLDAFEVNCREFAYQPDLKLHPKMIAFLRECLYEVLDRRWRRYIDGRPKSVLKIARSLRKAAFLYLRSNCGEVDRRRRSSAIDAFVTSKHLRAWDACIESEADYLIVLEDDAVFRDDSIEAIMSVLGVVSGIETEGPIYVDLAGGFSVAALRIGHLVQDRCDSLTRYRKMVTNTGCAYLLNREMIERSMCFLLARPHYRLIALDWFMNRMFMEFEKTGVQGICFHADPPALQHGSFTGEFGAWER